MRKYRCAKNSLEKYLNTPLAIAGFMLCPENLSYKRKKINKLSWQYTFLAVDQVSPLGEWKLWFLTKMLEVALIHVITLVYFLSVKGITIVIFIFIFLIQFEFSLFDMFQGFISHLFFLNCNYFQGYVMKRRGIQCQHTCRILSLYYIVGNIM